MRDLTPVLYAAIVVASLGGCSRSSDAVSSGIEAVSIARSEWGAAFIGDRKLRASRYDGKWIVTRERRPGDPREESIFIEARSGRVTRSSVETGELVLD